MAETLEGQVERVTFFNEETGFAVLRLQVRGRADLVTCLGALPAVNVGESVRAEGAWVRDAQHGLQFKAERLRTNAPTSREGIEKYLGGGSVRGIGPVLAAKLVKKFGERVFDIIESESARLEEVDKIGPERRRAIKGAWAEGRVVRDIMVFLHAHGAGGSRAVRIYKTYGEKSVALIRENPYRLARDIRGIGFKTADAIARRLGFGPDAPARLGAGLRHALHEAAGGAGHCALPEARLIAGTVALLDAEESAVRAALASALQAGELAREDASDLQFENEPLVYLPPLLKAERGVAQRLLALARQPPAWPALDAERALAWYEKKTGRALSPSQAEALRAMLGSRVFLLSGGPGVGKTTLLHALLTILQKKNLRPLLCAPTGRAAQRLGEATGLPARTIHRLLGAGGGGDGHFAHDERTPLTGDLVVVDECSMVDLPLAHALLRALPPAAGLLLVGDADQLPSVGPGAVLRDCLHSGALPAARLTEIFRQAEGSAIVVNAHRINRGELPVEPKRGEADADFFFIAREDPERIAETIAELVRARIPQRWQLDAASDIQVLCPTHRGPAGTRELNARLQEVLNPRKNDEPAVEKFGWTFRPRDKVIQNVNDYDKEVFNGDAGVIAEIDPAEDEVRVKFGARTVAYRFGELDELSPAYALSIHKAQGSEYPAVVIPLAVGQFLLLQRNLLYTGVTRARRLVVLVGQPRALALAVARAGGNERCGGLLARLRRGGNPTTSA
ncbi:MAG: ATP-dependent RecD-like DNA helicase [Verrucomicrobia bacterium]|nr:ATP-dependent RecD-like DNA helicase [Verrucomicrobiota bacterium]